MTAGKGRVRKDIEAATPAAKAAPPGGRPPPAFLVARFYIDADGLWKKDSDPDKAPLWVCTAFQVVAESRDGDRKSWGLLLSWIDPDGHAHEMLIPRAMFSGDGGELRAQLASHGLRMNPRTDARQAFLEYLNTLSTDKRAYSVLCCGWHVIEGVRVYVQPEGKIIGASKHRVILQTTSQEASTFNQAGTLEGWKVEVSSLCVGNSRPVLALCAAFAAPLLELLGEDGFGLHFHGKAKIAKTLLLAIAASAWGGTPGAGAKGFVGSWRTTVNGLETFAARHTHAIAALDEIGSIADPRELGDAVYMLGNGMGKARADRTGGMRAAIKYKLIYVSSGEPSIADKIAEGGKTMKAGQEVRLIDLQADPGRELGAFDTLNDHDTPQLLSKAIYDASKKHYGTAAPAFIRYLLDRIGRDPDFIEEVTSRIDALCKTWLAMLSDGGGQLTTVARRFALLAIAGETATSGLVTGWAPGEATRGAHACFRDWLHARGTTGSREDAQAAQQLRDYMSRNASSRFLDWREAKIPDAQQTAIDESEPPPERFRPVIRAGWRKWDSRTSRYTYFMLHEAMREALKGVDFNEAIKALAKQGLLVKDNAGKNTVSRKPPGEAAQRLYQLSIKAEEDADDEWQTKD